MSFTRTSLFAAVAIAAETSDSLSTVPPEKSRGSHIANSLVTEFGPVGRCAAMSEVYMTNRVAKLLVAAASVVACASITPVVAGTAGAVDECLAKPKDGTPSGQHWYYRIDRITKRQCWYLRDKDDASPQAAAPVPSEKNASLDRKNESVLTSSTADAFAALSSPRARLDGRAPAPPVAQTPSADATDEQDSSRNDPPGEQSPVASRWPDPRAVLSPAIERPAAPSLAVTSATSEPTAEAATGDAGDAPTVDTPSPAISLQMLLLAAFAAVAVSGLTGGAVYLARGRRRSQPEDASSAGAGWSPPDDHYRLYAPPRQARPVASPRGAETHSGDRLANGLTENGQEIAQLLARFANQAGAER